MVIHAYNPSTWEAKAGGLQVWDQPVLHSKTLSIKQTKKLKIWNVYIHKGTNLFYLGDADHPKTKHINPNLMEFIVLVDNG
jgi:hypothetical protein